MNNIKTKHKKKWKTKILFYLSIFIITFILTLQFIHRKNISFANQQFLRILLENSNSFLERESKKDITYQIIKQILKIDLKNPATLFQSNYLGSVATSSDEIQEEIESTYVEDPYPEKEIKEPLIYIYNTHQLEKYSTENIEIYDIVPNVMMASYILREKLHENDIPALVEEEDINQFLQTNNWNYASSYKVTRFLMEDAKEKNPTLNYFIDLHRDSVNKKITTTTIDNKNYAKILFVIGLENENYQENMNITKKVLDRLEKEYPSITRGIYKKQGPGVNGVYNQDFHKNVILVEMGGQENTIDEVLNSTLALSSVLTSLIKEGEI